jgi:hypothetical protein
MGKSDEPNRIFKNHLVTLPTRLFNAKSCTYHYHTKQTQGGDTFFLPPSISALDRFFYDLFRTLVPRRHSNSSPRPLGTIQTTQATRLSWLCPQNQDNHEKRNDRSSLRCSTTKAPSEQINESESESESESCACRCGSGVSC